MAQLGTSARPLRVAVVGAGPAGLYAAQALLDRPDLVLTVDVLNRFPTPFGLVRDGVAPDHQSIKAVTRVLERTLADPRVSWAAAAPPRPPSPPPRSASWAGWTGWT
jgi:ferredoxin/flavodoxin---NADP+ reductase